MAEDGGIGRNKDQDDVFCSSLAGIGDVAIEGQASTEPATLAVFHSSHLCDNARSLEESKGRFANEANEKDRDNLVGLAVTEGRHTYLGSLNPETDIRRRQPTPSSDSATCGAGVDENDADGDVKNNSEWLTEVMLASPSRCSEIQVTFQKDQSSSRDVVQVLVRETLEETNVVRVLWKGELLRATKALLQQGCFRSLEKTSESPYEDADNMVISSALTFARLVGRAHQRLSQRYQTATAALQQTRSNLERWKSTAEKLDLEVWQQEKDELTERFLILYNRVKSELVQVRRELNDQRQLKIEEVSSAKFESGVTDTGKARKSRVATTTRGSGQRRTGRPTQASATSTKAVVDDDEDQHDFQMFDPDEVHRLAEGKPVPNPVDPRPLFLAPTQTLSGDIPLKKEPEAEDAMDDGSSFIVSRRRRRQNPVTGVVEVSHVAALFADDDDNNNKDEKEGTTSVGRQCDGGADGRQKEEQTEEASQSSKKQKLAKGVGGLFL